jgi:hypothetical protein
MLTDRANQMFRSLIEHYGADNIDIEGLDSSFVASVEDGAEDEGGSVTRESVSDPAGAVRNLLAIDRDGI